MMSIAIFLLASSLRFVNDSPIVVRFDESVPESDARRLAHELKTALAEAVDHNESRPWGRVDVRLHGTTVGFAFLGDFCVPVFCA